MRTIGRGRLAVPVAMGAGLVTIAALLAATLSHTAIRRTGSNDRRSNATVAEQRSAPLRVCQDGELLPHGTGTLRFAMTPPATGGPRLDVTLLARGRTVARGSDPSGWAGPDVVVPVRPIATRDGVVRVCVALAASTGVDIGGEGSNTTRDGLAGNMRIDYLRPAAQSWWSFAGTVVAHMGRGHAFGGPVVAWLAAVLTLVSGALVAQLLLRETP
jgi:hypothetical protein